MRSLKFAFFRRYSDAFGQVVVPAVFAVVVTLSVAASSLAQTSTADAPVIVQPGAPGQPTKVLPPSTRPTLPPLSKKDAEFMRGMIMHHAQAVEMTAMIEARTNNKELRLLGARISQSQSDEMNFMRRWLETRGERVSTNSRGMMNMPGMDMSNMSAAGKQMMMPGMLTSEQMTALKNARGADFDRLFLTGMIQHHKGALVMVKDLFASPGAGQDAELFNFASDVDSGQRAEIRIMETMLGENP